MVQCGADDVTGKKVETWRQSFRIFFPRIEVVVAKNVAAIAELGPTCTHVVVPKLFTVPPEVSVF